MRPSWSSNGRGVAAEGIEEESLAAAMKRNRSVNNGRFLVTEIAGFVFAYWEERVGSGLGLGFKLAMDCSRVAIRVSSRLIRASWRSIRDGWIWVSVSCVISGFWVSDDAISGFRVWDWVSCEGRSRERKKSWRERELAVAMRKQGGVRFGFSRKPLKL